MRTAGVHVHPSTHQARPRNAAAPDAQQPLVPTTARAAARHTRHSPGTHTMGGLLHPLVVWGLGPVVCSFLGWAVTAGVLELVLASGWLDGSRIAYAVDRAAGRKQLLAKTHERIPFRKQLRGCVRMLLGPPALLSGAGLALLLTLVGGGTPDAWAPPSVASALWQFLALAVINDFGLYWGHRVQHEVEALWVHHAKHHAIDTPSPVSAVFIDPLDATLQASLPILLAALCVRPPPLLLYLFVACRVGENTLNHSGLDSTLVDILTLKVLPLRASIGHHDSHHKFSNHSGRATNFGETFWLWDWAFGTRSSLMGVAAARVARASSD